MSSDYGVENFGCKREELVPLTDALFSEIAVFWHQCRVYMLPFEHRPSFTLKLETPTLTQCGL